MRNRGLVVSWMGGGGGWGMGGLLSMPSHKSRDPLLLDREGLKQPVTTVRIKAKASQAHLSRKRK